MFVLSKTDDKFGGKRYRTMTIEENSLPLSPSLVTISRGRPRWKQTTPRRSDGGERVVTVTDVERIHKCTTTMYREERRIEGSERETETCLRRSYQ